MRYLYLFVIFASAAILEAKESKSPSAQYVYVNLEGQFGNQLFQIATAYAYSLDNHLPFTVPDLVKKTQFNIPFNAKHIFLPKIDSYVPTAKTDLVWKEPSFNYCKIPYGTRVSLQGWFQSEKYFKHRRKEIIELFAPPQWLKKEIVSKYAFLDANQYVVGIQIRDYRKEMPTEQWHPTIKRAYYQKAMSYFPDNTLFLVSSNNLTFAKECVEDSGRNIIYLQGESYLEEFYTLLLLAKSFIISNSTFGWWASWLSSSQDKIVIAPDPWFALPYDNSSMTKDLLPPEYFIIRVGDLTN